MELAIKACVLEWHRIQVLEDPIHAGAPIRRAVLDKRGARFGVTVNSLDTGAGTASVTVSSSFAD